MLKSSESEFNRLVVETREVKNCITRYVSYIIAVFGLSSIIFKYTIENQPEAVIGLLLSIAIIITFLLELIVYKIHSHNQYVGYMQLLSQEQNHYKLNAYYDKNNRNKYLVKPGTGINASDLNNIGNLETWEFVKSRLNSSKLHGTIKFEDKAVDKSTYHFVPPNNLGFSALPSIEFVNLDQNFFKHIIHNIYNSKTFKLSNNILLDITRKFKYIYSGKFKQTNTFKIDNKYIVGGWTYPLKIMQVTLLVMISIVFLIWHLLISKFDFNPCHFLVLPTIYGLISLSIFAFIIYQYVIKLPDLILGHRSIDYYCWTFFLFRVQILNRYKIVPEYFSRSYIRYHKSKVISFILENRFSHLNLKEASDHKTCIANVDLEGNRRKKQEGLCNDCIKKYKNAIATFQEFDESSKIAHLIIYKKINTYLKNIT